MKSLLPLMALALLLAGCAANTEDAQPQSQAPSEAAESLSEESICISACKMAKARGSIDSGPCLLNPIEEYPGWVCDVAHYPRQDIDNLPENQCSAYRERAASNFIELDTRCNIIKKA